MSVINDIIEIADDELRYPTSSELDAVKQYMGTGARRLRIAEILSENRKKLLMMLSACCLPSVPNIASRGATHPVPSDITSACEIMTGTCA